MHLLLIINQYFMLLFTQGFIIQNEIYDKNKISSMKNLVNLVNFLQAIE